MITLNYLIFVGFDVFNNHSYYQQLYIMDYIYELHLYYFICIIISGWISIHGISHILAVTKKRKIILKIMNLKTKLRQVKVICYFFTRTGVIIVKTQNRFGSKFKKTLIFKNLI